MLPSHRLDPFVEVPGCHRRSPPPPLVSGAVGFSLAPQAAQTGAQRSEWRMFAMFVGGLWGWGIMDYNGRLIR
jgi:hypothetical protein